MMDSTGFQYLGQSCQPLTQQFLELEEQDQIHLMVAGVPRIGIDFFIRLRIGRTRFSKMGTSFAFTTRPSPSSKRWELSGQRASKANVAG